MFSFCPSLKINLQIAGKYFTMKFVGRLTQNAKIVPPRAVKSLYQHTDIHVLVDINDAKLYRISKAAGVNWARRQRQLNFMSCVFFSFLLSFSSGHRAPCFVSEHRQALSYLKELRKLRSSGNQCYELCQYKRTQLRTFAMHTFTRWLGWVRYVEEVTRASFVRLACVSVAL